MADTKLSALTELAATPADADEVYIRDVSEEANAESKRITIANLLAGAGGATLTVAETEVLAGNSPNPSAWTDLNLSGTIGGQATLVLLKIGSANPNFQVSVRKNGDTDEFFGAAADVGGAATSPQGGGKYCVLIVATDASGIIEWKADNVTVAYTIDIIAYIK